MTTDIGIMPVAVQLRDRPETQTLFMLAMHRDLRHLLANGYEFPRVLICGGPFGAYIAGPLHIEEERAI